MNAISKILSYPATVVFYLCFGITILVFHPIQWVCLNVFGYAAHKKSVDYLNWFTLRCLNIVGTRFDVTFNGDIPLDVPIILVSNHQSMWDIPPIVWYFRKIHPKFISKIELGKGIPSISYNLRHGGSVLIDRKNPKQALGELVKFSKYLVKFNRSGIIFPEGTRSRNGVPKPFRRTGLLTLFKKAPSAYALPISISHSWKLQRNGMFPIPIGVKMKIEVHPALKVSDFTPDELIDTLESTITSKIEL